MINKNLHIIPEIFFLILMLILPIECFSAVRTGLDVLTKDHSEMIRGKSISLLTAKTAIDINLMHSIDCLAKTATIKTIFTGDAYFRETIPDSKSGLMFDALTNARVIEIHDPLKYPDEDTFADSELLIIDFQDIGIRYFKYLTLMAQFLDLASRTSIPVLVLDRPNPVSASNVCGPVLETNLRSRFGVYPIPLLHGMTIGEIALYFNKVFGIGANLTVIGMEGYSRIMDFRDTNLHWVPPSDHIPNPETPAFYGATGFLGEMGVFSTGVGTTRPFHYILAPWIDGEILSQQLEKYALPGVRFIQTVEKPYYGLFSMRKTAGIEIIIVDRLEFDPFLTGMTILKALYELYPDRIPLTNPAAAEAIDTLLGSSKIRHGIIAKRPIMEIYVSLQVDTAEFIKKRQEFLIYQD